MKMNFESQTFVKRFKSMIKVDFRRLFTTRLFYIMVGVSFIIPILVLVMTTMMDGTVSVNPQTGVETVIEGFDNVWQSIATTSSENSSMSMDLTSMCNINMLYFLVSVLVCIFVSDDFRSGFSKILFTRRSKKCEYIISKTLVLFISGAFMIIAWLFGAIIGGTISGLSFDLSVGINGLVMCIIAKILLMLIFISIFLLMSVIAKQKLWMSIIGSLMIGMLFFMIIPIVTPLDSNIMNVVLCLISGLIFSTVIGVVSNRVLRKTDLV